MLKLSQRGIKCENLHQGFTTRFPCNPRIPYNITRDHSIDHDWMFLKFFHYIILALKVIHGDQVTSLAISSGVFLDHTVTCKRTTFIQMSPFPVFFDLSYRRPFTSSDCCTAQEKGNKVIIRHTNPKTPQPYMTSS